MEFRIIIIDDNPNIHQDVIKVLTIPHKTSKEFNELDAAIFGKDQQDDNYEYLPKFLFDTATQGIEGVEKIKRGTESGKPYALAFVDIRMPPGWDGIETIKRIWKIDPNIQIVICTAFSDYNWEETIKKLGMSDNFLILKKPFDNMAIRQIACALTQKWLLTQDARKHTEFLNQTVIEKTQSLQRTLSLLHATLESTTEGILVVDLKGVVIDYNKRFVRLFNIPKALLSAHDSNLVQKFIINTIENPKDLSALINRLRVTIDEDSQLTIRLKNGKIFEVASQPHRLSDVTVGRVWSFKDVTERAFMMQELEYQATHDMLTSLPNRILLHDRINQSISMALRHKNLFATLFFDLDRFKIVNDSLGHEFGDQLLCKVAKRLSKTMRKADTLARLGGDEFVIILPGLAKKEEAIRLANKIILAFQEPFKIAGQDILISSSMGISLFPSNGKTVSTLLKNADLAMYQAKEHGGNQFKFYTMALNRQSKKQLSLDIDLRHALQKKQFFLVYQPQLDIVNQHFLSVEALIRWHHPAKGIMPPLTFIPEAEESGLIIPIGEWVIQEACRQINAWRKVGLPYITVAVNVAASQLKQANFDKVVYGILQKYKIAPNYIEIEITENVIINVEVRCMINKLRDLGLKISLDDFGTGNSSLTNLTQIKIDRIKIDRSFVKNIGISHKDEVIIEATISMAKNMGFKVLAEGVDSQNQIDFLKSKLCDEVQGFIYSKPLTATAIVDYVRGKLANSV